MAQPLKKIKEDDGTLYTRFPEIEAAVDVALGHDLDRLGRRATIRDRKSRDYLPSECLVHLIRDAHRRDDESRRDRLLVALLERCHAILNKKVDGDLPNAIMLRKQILNDFAALFAVDGSPDDKLGLDYFEVRFNHAFQRFRISRLRPVLALLEKRLKFRSTPARQWKVSSTMRCWPACHLTGQRCQPGRTRFSGIRSCARSMLYPPMNERRWFWSTITASRSNPKILARPRRDVVQRAGTYNSKSLEQG